MRMKDILLATVVLAGVSGGGLSLGPNRGSNSNIPLAPQGSEGQRKLFKAPVKLSKKQRAKLKKTNRL